ncbi:hypothetical protein XELAEV_18023457mg [Xenopus laevis]|uniref:Uncharacterized protein n=1 Tax=Xenopus laevis TaxID=8355 RepID=A0A974HP38_XENLA|nr:hypothetical protein XELAEV_18023457mg [Xenopus laevis]
MLNNILTPTVTVEAPCEKRLYRATKGRHHATLGYCPSQQTWEKESAVLSLPVLFIIPTLDTGREFMILHSDVRQETSAPQLSRCRSTVAMP